MNSFCTFFLKVKGCNTVFVMFRVRLQAYARIWR